MGRDRPARWVGAVRPLTGHPAGATPGGMLIWKLPVRVVGVVWTVAIWLVIAAAITALVLLAAAALAVELS